MTGPGRRRRNHGPAPHKVQVRFDDAEHAAVHAAAGRVGRGVSVARFVAEAALVAAGRRTAEPEPRRAMPRLWLAEIADAVVAVNRVGNNLNQLAREKNATGHRPVGTFEEIERALAALDDLTHRATGAARDSRGSDGGPS